MHVSRVSPTATRTSSAHANGDANTLTRSLRAGSHEKLNEAQRRNCVSLECRAAKRYVLPKIDTDIPSPSLKTTQREISFLTGELFAGPTPTVKVTGN